MLKLRVVTAIVLLAIVLLLVFRAPPGLFAFGITLIATAGAWEWSRLGGISTDRGEIIYASVVGSIALAGMHLLPATSRANPLLLMMGAILTVITTLGIYYLRWHAPLASPWLLLYALSIVWLRDIGAYFAGRRFGQHKLSPLISPGKSWEGVWGGMLVTTVFMLLILVLVDMSSGYWWKLMLATMLGGAVSVLGDLYESRLKRAAGRKDSSELLPGHGGVLDRIDGVIAGLPVFAAVWLWL